MRGGPCTCACAFLLGDLGRLSPLNVEDRARPPPGSLIPGFVKENLLRFADMDMSRAECHVA